MLYWLSCNHPKDCKTHLAQTKKGNTGNDITSGKFNLGQSQHVTFARKRLTVMDCRRIGLELASNRTATSLNLHQTKIGDAGVEHICKGLAVNSHLKTLYLGGCAIGDTGATFVSEAMRQNDTLHTLNMQFSKV